MQLDYLGHIERESARFEAALLAAPADAPVPSCPGWTASDLLWHLAEVQWFWGEIVRSGARSPDEYAEPARPADRTGLETFYRVASGGLLAALAAAEPDTPAWTWSEDQTVGFIRRRQAHEALVHRVDAELTAGERTPMDPLLSTDGIDEALRVMYGGCPAWATFVPDTERPLRITATDTGRSWLVTLGRFRGTRPSDGKAYDEATLDVADDSSGTLAASATWSGTAADVDCALWNRPPLHAIERSGDEALLDAFAGVLAEGVQ
jgi:uncharacterized protein (TIGR03083 family)